MPFELELGYELPLPVACITDLQQPQYKESAKTLECCNFLEWLQHLLQIFCVELYNADNKPPSAACQSQHPPDPAITASVKVLSDTKDLLITFANINATWCKLVHFQIGP